MKTKFITLIIALFYFNPLFSQDQSGTGILNLNKPERLEWFQDAGFGMFIHFSFDSQLGIVISHSMVGASEDYLDRFINELPQTFNPKNFSAEDIAVLAKIAGMKYIVLTTKHHSGFCLWDTKTTDFNIMNTPYGKDLVNEYVEAVRAQGLGVGFYFSPEDFNFLHEQKQTVRRRFPEPLSESIMEKYLDLTEKQLTELMSNYGKIDVLFFDGGEGPLQEKSKEVCWDIQPDVLVTRGAMLTPEQFVPGLAIDEPWEGNLTMGTQWQYKPTNDNYKSGTRLIEVLIETRAKGGTQLLNVGPKPNGELPDEQEERIREVAAWTFINRESIESVRPWIITNEENIWFTRKKDASTVYAYITKLPDWPRGERKEFVLKSVKATKNTKVSILGQTGEVVEYNPDADGKTYFEQKENGLHISCVRAHRIYNNHKWHNPIVIKLENVEQALDPPFVKTLKETKNNGMVVLNGEVLKTGDAEEISVGFEYRPYLGFAEALYAGEWKKTELLNPKNKKTFQVELSELEKGKEYEFRAIIIHPQIVVPGDVLRFKF
ncbi:alpha-L-fucosidase [Flexithrix dorotheae]|uniref:alpha-L-fucosidase n=1 Tax=Flexithrix dorotheae TaxID=70993 RepID=UPI0003802B64|nr:alpha-L-fucosidase [Flexithrix dorotheae]